jgi:hypothetical protein
MSELEPSDKRSAVVGLIVTSIALFIIAFSIVQLTNMQYAGEGTAAEATR